MKNHFNVILLTGVLALEMVFASSAFAYIDEVQTTLENFSPYKPNYFLLGSPDTKAQISLKVQPISAFPLFFGYSQLLMWDLFKSSAPIRDINYNPEVFARIPFGDDNARRWLDISPYEHESNGKDGSDSRDWNRAYIRYSEGPSATGRKLQWSLKLWLTYPNVDTEVQKHRGLAEFTVTLSDFLGSFWKRGDLSLRLYPGGVSLINPLQGGQELTLRVKFQEPHFLPLMVLQIFHGYGENLLNANEERWSFRAGIGL